MFRRDRIGRRGGGVSLYEAVWCNIVTGNSTLTITLVYRSPNINEEDNSKLQNAIKEVSKGECIVMGDFNHGHIQWTFLESTVSTFNSR